MDLSSAIKLGIINGWIKTTSHPNGMEGTILITDISLDNEFIPSLASPEKITKKESFAAVDVSGNINLKIGRLIVKRSDVALRAHGITNVKIQSSDSEDCNTVIEASGSPEIQISQMTAQNCNTALKEIK